MDKEFLGSSKEAGGRTWPGLEWLRRIVSTRSTQVLGQLDAEYLRGKREEIKGVLGVAAHEASTGAGTL
jgi:hypothetical protein